MKRIALISVILFSSLIFAGCQTRCYSKNIASPAFTQLEKSQKIYISFPENGSYGSRTDPKSAEETVKMLRTAIAPYVASSVSGSVVESTSQAIESGRNIGATYVFVPIITNWEQRAAAWSGISTKASFLIQVYDLSNPGSVDPIVIKELQVQGRTVTLVSQYLRAIITPLFNQLAQELFDPESITQKADDSGGKVCL